MARPVSGEIKTCEIRREQKNGSIYVYAREYIYDPVKRQNKTLRDTLLYKIVDGVQMPTRPKKKPVAQAAANENNENQEQKEETLTATKKRTGAAKILDVVGEKSGIDQALYDITHVGDAKKILSLARFLVCPKTRIIVTQKPKNCP